MDFGLLKVMLYTNLLAIGFTSGGVYLLTGYYYFKNTI